MADIFGRNRSIKVGKVKMVCGEKPRPRKVKYRPHGEAKKITFGESGAGSFEYLAAYLPARRAVD